MNRGSRLVAIIKQQCPVCLQGRMFRGRFTMNEACAVCGHRFERELGFFQGAMFVSYGIGVIYLIALAIVAREFVAPRFGMPAAIAVVIVVHLACVPGLFRYARVIWAHLNVQTMPR